MWDGLPAACRPRLIRGDVSYGNEQTMLEAESRGQGYLFKLLSVAFRVWLRGKGLHPVVEGNQTLLLLTT